MDGSEVESSIFFYGRPSDMKRVHHIWHIYGQVFRVIKWKNCFFYAYRIFVEFVWLFAANIDGICIV